MNERIVADTNAIIDFIRPDRASPPQMRGSALILLPLPAIGELFSGAFISRLVDENLSFVDDVIARWPLLIPDLSTAREYGRLRAKHHFEELSVSKRNDLWIAALCIQHDLPLLANDHGFDTIKGLRVLPW